VEERNEERRLFKIFNDSPLLDPLPRTERGERK
jgi:hypothetical protein